MVTVPPIDWDTFRADKQERFAHFMADKGLDHVVLSGFDNFRWLTDHSKAISSDSAHDYFVGIIAADGQTTVIACDVDEDVEQPFEHYPWITRYIAGPSWASFWTHVPIFVRLVARELQASGARHVGVEIAHYEVMEALRQEFPEIVFKPVAWDLLELRKIKLPAEIILLEHASKVSSIAMAAGLNGADEGVSDREIAELAIDAMYKNGAEWVSHYIVVINSPGDFWLPTGKYVWKGDTVMMDLGCYTAGGYCADFCRMRFVGEPHSRVVDTYRILLEAQEAGVAAAKPGVRCSEITETIDGVLRKNGLPTTPYGMGHGIGLRVMELPCIYREEFMMYDDRLSPGMVICIEPATTVEVNGKNVKVKNEDQYVVEDHGLCQLTLPGSAID